MKILHGISQLPTFDSTAITIGAFDGIHFGHRTLISKLVDVAKINNIPSVLIIFSPHPRRVVQKSNQSFKQIYLLEENLKVLESQELDFVVVVNFDDDLKNMDANLYVHDFLIHHFHPKFIITGRDHFFGKNKSGNLDLLKTIGIKYNFEVISLDLLSQDKRKISSTLIRNLLTEGNIIEANNLLVDPYSIHAKVINGKKIARDLGFPTANLDITAEKLIPANGVYATSVDLGDGTYKKSITYIGASRTLINQNKSNVEVHIFDFNQEIYDQNITLFFHSKIRDDIKFVSKEELIFNISLDKEAVLRYFNREDNFSTPNIAIVLLCFNNRQFLEKYLPSVIATQSSYSYELVIIDNGSSDDTRDFLQIYYPNIRLIHLTDNHGFAGGYNQGLKSLTHKYIVLLNSDIEVHPFWLNPLIEELESHTEVAAVQPKILDLKKKETFEYAGAAGGFMDKLGFPYCRGRVMNEIENDHAQYDDNCKIFWASGAAIAMRSEDFWEILGFDESFFAHQEEIDLCWRLQRANRVIKYRPDSIVYHLGGGSLSYESPNKVYLNFRNNKICCFKNELFKDKYILKLLRNILNLLAMLQFLLGRSFQKFIKVYEAERYFYQNIFTIKERKKSEDFAIARMKRKFTICREINFGVKSIIWRYYICRQKKYSQIKNNEK